MVGTLKEVATSIRCWRYSKNSKLVKNRKYAGITAPPQGLTLKKFFIKLSVYKVFHT